MSETKKDQPDQPKQPARSAKPGAHADQTSTDIIHDEAVRTKSSSSANRNKRTHRQSTARRPAESDR
jgi:hypothetical protein